MHQLTSITMSRAIVCVGLILADSIALGSSEQGRIEFSPRRQDPTGPAVVHGSSIQASPRYGLGPNAHTTSTRTGTGRPSGLRVTCGH